MLFWTAVAEGIIVFPLFCQCQAEDRQLTITTKGGETLTITNLPSYTSSEPITNGFLYIDGEYIPAPYVVSVSNLAVCVNGYVLCDYAPRIKKKKAPPTGYILPSANSPIKQAVGMRQGGLTPEYVGTRIDSFCEAFAEGLRAGSVDFYANGFPCKSYLLHDGDGGATALVAKARKAILGDAAAERELIQEMGLEGVMSTVRPDWIHRLANNTNLEVRATRILESKRQREQKEREKNE